MSAAQPLSFKCESCQTRYRLRPELAGQKVRCKCGHTMTAPALPANVRLDDEASRRMMNPAFAELFEEEEDRKEEAELDEAAPSDRSRRVYREQSSESWKWWHLVVAGALIVAFSVYQIVESSPLIQIGGKRAGPVGGLILGSLAILIGVWSRPRR